MIRYSFTFFQDHFDISIVYHHCWFHHYLYTVSLGTLLMTGTSYHTCTCTYIPHRSKILVYCDLYFQIGSHISSSYVHSNDTFFCRSCIFYTLYIIITIDSCQLALSWCSPEEISITCGHMLPVKVGWGLDSGSVYHLWWFPTNEYVVHPMITSSWHWVGHNCSTQGSGASVGNVWDVQANLDGIWQWIHVPAAAVFDPILWSLQHAPATYHAWSSAGNVSQRHQFALPASQKLNCPHLWPIK